MILCRVFLLKYTYIYKRFAPEIKEKTIVGSKKLKKFEMWVGYFYKYNCNIFAILFLKKNISNELSLIVSNIPAYLPHVSIVFIDLYIYDANNPLIISCTGHSQFVPVPITEVITQRSNSIDGSLSFVRFFYGQLTSSVIFETAQGVLLALDQCQCVGPYRVSDFINLELPTVFKCRFRPINFIFFKIQFVIFKCKCIINWSIFNITFVANTSINVVLRKSSIFKVNSLFFENYFVDLVIYLKCNFYCRKIKNVLHFLGIRGSLIHLNFCFERLLFVIGRYLSFYNIEFLTLIYLYSFPLYDI
uniref:Uncharacterized protein n=1 Tax=Heterorhabditis bacteriophora TaxID=37862 RepID=A0A1I7WT24_HETBA